MRLLVVLALFFGASVGIGEEIPRLILEEYTIFTVPFDRYGRIDVTPFADSVRQANDLPKIMGDWSRYLANVRWHLKSKRESKQSTDSSDPNDLPTGKVLYEVTTSDGVWSIVEPIRTDQKNDTIDFRNDTTRHWSYDVKLNHKFVRKIAGYISPVCAPIAKVASFGDNVIIEYRRDPDSSFPLGYAGITDIMWNETSLCDSLGWQSVAEFWEIGNAPFCVLKKDGVYGFWYNHVELPQKYDFVVPSTCQGDGTWDPVYNSEGFQAFAYRDGTWLLVVGRAITEQE